jgi:phosphate-selective porin
MARHGRNAHVQHPGGFFNQVSPARPVFQGGPGAWELVARFSYIDLDDHAVSGGTFWRLTPMVNWHLSDNVRLEMTYGYGSLNRLGASARPSSSKPDCRCNSKGQRFIREVRRIVSRGMPDTIARCAA